MRKSSDVQPCGAASGVKRAGRFARRTVPILASTALAASVFVAGISAASAATDQARSSTGVVHAATVEGLGNVLVDANGYLLYAFMPDQRKSVNCTDQCQFVWPPLTTTGKPVAGAGVNARLLGTVTSGSERVVTYNGWPLYTFFGDHGPAQSGGEGLESFNGVWWAISPRGVPVKVGTPHSGSF